MNKIKLLILTVLVSAGVAVAQNVTTPYSMYGYGILGDRATSMQRQMGSVGYAMNSGRQINVMNPASYASIDSLTFLFDIGADLSVLWQKEGELKQRTTGGGLDYVTMQFPICKFMGGSIGMLPYSSVGYAFGKSIDHGAMENQGNGGINQAYIGLAGKYAGFSLGVNFAYSFGNIINDVYSTPNSAGQSLFEHVMEIRDWDVNLGLQYTARLSRTERITAGVTFSPKKSLHGNTWATIQELKHESVPDTVASMKISGNYYTPMSIGAGIAYKHERNSRWMLEADFTFQQWSKAKYSAMYENADPDNMVFQGMDFNNRTKFALGGEFVPKIRGNYVQRISYRAGAYYNNDYLNIRGNRVREYGVTAGFGLNTPEGKTMINLGIEWKHRQAHPNPLLTENYLNITLGVNINEVWFFKRPIK
ncbi:hypothetical protein EEL33_17910 [Muribaculaceae bacterium Isolate-037 (Harlan)]|jgi:hypothetical protein|nr:hypothetical protein EEL33_17910 [Muribaculaceae bacterium Isolate-037 (Harlan)]